MKYESTRDIDNRLSITTLKNVVVSLHFHRSIELIFIEEGGLNLKIGEEELRFEAGEIAFIPEYFAHGTLDVVQNKVTNCIIPYSYYKAVKGAGVALFFTKLDDKAVNAEIWEVIQKAKKYLYRGRDFFDRGFSEIILALITESYVPQNIQTGSNEFIIRVIEYIEGHFKEEISLGDIAKEFKYSPYYFSRLFNRAFGCGLNRYVNQVRYNYVLDNCEKELCRTDLILKAGFGDLSAFYKFKKRTLM